MLINATYNGNKVLLNSDYIVDIWEQNEGWAVYTLDNDSGCYLIEDAEMQRLLKADKER